MSKGYWYIIVLALILVLAFVLDAIFGEDFIVEDKQVPIKENPAYSSDPVVSEEEEDLERIEQEDVPPPATASEETTGATDFEPTTFVNQIENYRDSILVALPQGERRQDVVVRYYPHDPDGDVVYRLSEIGYYVHKRKTTEGLDNVATNSLYYGDDVDVRDIQLVAWFLMEQGVVLRQIRESRYHADWKANAIEVGASLEARKQEPLSLGDIERFEKEF